MNPTPLRPAIAALGLLLLSTVPVVLGAAEPEPGFTPLFNGTDLTGWKPVNTAPSTWSVRDGMIICTGKPIGELRTEHMYQNFILELEWRHLVPRGNAGVFVWADDITARGQPFHRAVEVQVLENAYGNGRGHTTHGDVFPIHGARMNPVNGRGGSRAFPTEERSKPSPEWNHYRITCVDGAISLAVNGKIVTRGTDASPRKGYICLESEGGVVHYRNLRIKELPGKPLDPRYVATPDRGYRCLYNGVDFSGWIFDRENNGAWQSRDWILGFSNENQKAAAPIATRENFGDFGFILDLRRNEASGITRVFLRGTEATAVVIDPNDPLISKQMEKGWNRFEGVLTGNRLTLTLNGGELFSNRPLEGAPATGPFRLVPDGPVDFANIYVRKL